MPHPSELLLNDECYPSPQQGNLPIISSVSIVSAITGHMYVTVLTVMAASDVEIMIKLSDIRPGMKELYE